MDKYWNFELNQINSLRDIKEKRRKIHKKIKYYLFLTIDVATICSKPMQYNIICNHIFICDLLNAKVVWNRLNNNIFDLFRSMSSPLLLQGSWMRPGHNGRGRMHLSETMPHRIPQAISVRFRWSHLSQPLRAASRCMPHKNRHFRTTRRSLR